MLTSFLEEDISLKVSNSTSTLERIAWRRRVKESNGRVSLSRYISGKLPYFYRDPAKIAEDFIEKLDAINSMADMCRKLPTTDKFRTTHFAEILSAIYIEEILGFKILMRKLTQTTAEDTNVHKMDVMCVDTSKRTYDYMWIEAKSSQQSGKRVYHRHGIYKQMKDSLEKYTEGDKRFDFVTIRDNLSKADFSKEEISQIKKDLSPPGPIVTFHGMAVINVTTVSQDDDDYVLTIESPIKYNVRILALTDIKNQAVRAYQTIEDIMRVAEGAI